ncbi:MAG: FAD:protein FMN transferase [Acidobacteria bacterium]|nr:FAD:protein FMN transferase [Acidobacteriota bacterium]
MGTRFELVLPPQAGFQAIGELVMAEIDEWHQRLSRFAPDSWVSHVNRLAADEPVRCDGDVWALLVEARSVWRDSDGAFDITKGHGDALILDASSHTVRFGRTGMALDLGGIGKGHALDRAVHLLRAHGVTSAFLHGGTSSGYALGCDSAGQPWRVSVQPGADAPVLHLDDTAFAVSDAASQPHAHIVDPRSGADVDGAHGRGAVAVTGPSARLCDAWATALVVLADTRAESPDHQGPEHRGYTVHWLPETKR